MSVTIDLKALYGTDKLTKGQRFSTGHDATKFILDYGLKNNKKLHVPQTGGRCNQYRCKSACCEWSATMTKQKKPPFDYKVSSLNDNHSDMCMAPVQPTQRQISSLPEFQVAVLSDAKVSGKALMTSLGATSKIVLAQHTAQVYRAKQDVLSANRGDYDESFKLLQSLLTRDGDNRNFPVAFAIVSSVKQMSGGSSTCASKLAFRCARPRLLPHQFSVIEASCLWSPRPWSEIRGFVST